MPRCTRLDHPKVLPCHPTCHGACSTLGPFIGTPLEAGTIARTWARVLATAGVGHVLWHDLRHAHATIMLRQGVHPKVVSERLGHADVAITLDTYSHVLPGLQERAASALDLALAEPSMAEAR